MASPRSFRRTLRAAHLKLVYSHTLSVSENIKLLEEAVKRVGAAIPLPSFEETEAESGVLEMDKTSVLAMPRRDRDPAMVQQEINGCKGLLLEVIRRAAYDWVLYRTSRRLFHRKLADQAYQWLFKEQEGHPDWRERMQSGKHVTSFLGICTLLDLDPESVRVHVRRLTPKNVMSVGRPPEYRRREIVVQEEASVPMTDTDFESDWTPSTPDDNFDE